jgi:hypothetical protein
MSPKLAHWLLTHTGTDDSLTGDLIEQHSTGKSLLWLWAQVLAAVASGTARAIRTHKLLALRATLTGWIVLLLCFQLSVMVHTQLSMGALIGLKLWWWQYVGVALEPWATCVSVAIMGVSSGWIVARFHSTCGAKMVLVYLASHVAYSVAWLWWFGERVMQDPHTYSPSEWLNVTISVMATIIILPIGIIVGGLSGEQHEGPRASSWSGSNE